MKKLESSNNYVFKTELQKITNHILEKHRFLGEIAQELVECYKNECFTSALFDLFILTEHLCKNSNDVSSGNFHKTIDDLYENKKITPYEKKILNELKSIRNKMFHENLAIWIFEINGIAYPFSETETRKILYEKYAKDIFKIF